MAAIQGTKLGQFITAGDTDATFATHVDIYGQGGLMSFTNLSQVTTAAQVASPFERLTTDRQKQGMLMYDSNTTAYYTLTTVSTNANLRYTPLFKVNTDGSLVINKNVGIFEPDPGNRDRLTVNGNISANGNIKLSEGTTSAKGIQFHTDVFLYRSAANTLRLDDNFVIAFNGGKTTLNITDTTVDTGITIGGDVNLYRSTNNTLKTDDELVVGILNTSTSNSVIVETGGKLEKRTLNSNSFDTNATFLSGSPTTNRVLKLNSLNTVGNSIIHDNGTNIGINNTSPNELLTVSGNVSASGRIYITTLDTNNSSNTVIVENATELERRTINSRVWDTNATFLTGSPTNNSILRLTSTNTIGDANIVQDTNSRIGINTSTPNERLTISGNISASGKFYVTTLDTATNSNDVIVEVSTELEKRTINSRVWDTNATFLTGSPTVNRLLRITSLNTVGDTGITVDNSNNVGSINNLSINGAITLPATGANLVFAGPDSSSGAPFFRTLVANDIPNLATSKITSGTLAIARGGTNSSTALNNGRVMISNGGAIVESTITTTELGYLDNVTSDIQSQLNGLTDIFQLNENDITPFVFNNTISGSSAFSVVLSSNSIYEISYNFKGDYINTPGTVLSSNNAFDYIYAGNATVKNILFTDLPNNPPIAPNTNELFAFIYPKIIITKSNPTTVIMGLTGNHLGAYTTLLSSGSFIRFQKIK